VFAGEPIRLVEPAYKRLELAADVIETVCNAADAQAPL